MNVLKEIFRVLLSVLASVFVFFFPALLSIMLYYITIPLFSQFNSCNDFIFDLGSFSYGSIATSFISFFFFMWLFNKRREK